MSDEANNVSLLQQAYGRWADSKGASADHWLSIMADRIKFGSLAQGGHGAAYLTAYQSRDDLAQYFAGIERDWEMIEFVPERPGDFGGKEVTGKKAWQELGWKPKVEFEEGLRLTVEWFRQKWGK